MEKWPDGTVRFCVDGRKPDVALAACSLQTSSKDIDAGSGAAQSTHTRATTSDASDVCTPSPDATEISGDSSLLDAVSSDETSRVSNSRAGKVPQDPTSVTPVGRPQLTIAPVSLRTTATQHPESQHQGAAVTQCQAPLACTDDSPCPAPHARPPQQCTAMPMDPARMALDNEIVPQK